MSSLETPSGVVAGVGRLRRVGKTVDGQPIYRHPNGWLIVRDERDWNWVRGAAGWAPKINWLIIPGRYTNFRKELASPHYVVTLLREARAWCDGNVCPTSTRARMRSPKSVPVPVSASSVEAHPEPRKEQRDV